MVGGRGGGGQKQIDKVCDEVRNEGYPFMAGVIASHNFRLKS